MKNIIRIARNDIHNIRKNVIALIVIFGITIVPSLYAWFNIAASWDPYKNTGNLKVAVASLDKGYDGELLPVRLNLGNDIISSLRENTQLHWIFTDAKDASNGVRSGKYYASVVISETFSKDMMSLFSSETTHPTITYCINEKENVRKLTKPSQRQFPKQLWTHFVLLLTFPQKKGMHLLQKIYLLRLQKSLPILILLPELYRHFLI